MLVRVVTGFLGVLFLAAGGLLTYWLVLYRNFVPLDLAGPVILAAGVGLMMLRKWAAVLARMICAVMAGLYVCLGLAVAVGKPEGIEFDPVSMAGIVLCFAGAALFFSRASVLKYFK